MVHDGMPGSMLLIGLRYGLRLRFAHCVRSLLFSLQMLEIGRIIVIKRILMSSVIFLLLVLLRLVRIDRTVLQFLRHVDQIFVRHLPRPLYAWVK